MIHFQSRFSLHGSYKGCSCFFYIVDKGRKLYPGALLRQSSISCILSRPKYQVTLSEDLADILTLSMSLTSEI